MMVQRRPPMILGGVVAILLSGGCEGRQAPPALHPTLSSAPWPTSSPTIVPSPSPTPLVPWLLATLTPRPPVLTAQGQERVIELLRTNGGCELPCYWRIT